MLLKRLSYKDAAQNTVEKSKKDRIEMIVKEVSYKNVGGYHQNFFKRKQKIIVSPPHLARIQKKNMKNFRITLVHAPKIFVIPLQKATTISSSSQLPRLCINFLNTLSQNFWHAKNPGQKIPILLIIILFQKSNVSNIESSRLMRILSPTSVLFTIITNPCRCEMINLSTVISLLINRIWIETLCLLQRPALLLSGYVVFLVFGPCLILSLWCSVFWFFVL